MCHTHFPKYDICFWWMSFDIWRTNNAVVFNERVRTKSKQNRNNPKEVMVFCRPTCRPQQCYRIYIDYSKIFHWILLDIILCLWLSLFMWFCILVYHQKIKDQLYCHVTWNWPEHDVVVLLYQFNPSDVLFPLQPDQLGKRNVTQKRQHIWPRTRVETKEKRKAEQQWTSPLTH